jgi:hypothetical protein
MYAGLKEVIKQDNAEKLQIIGCTNLAATLTAKSLDYEARISRVKEYSEIMQTLNAGARNNKYLSDPFCSGRNDIRHIEKITVAVSQDGFNIVNKNLREASNDARITSDQSNYSKLVMQVSAQGWLSLHYVENLMDMALHNYKLHCKKHELSYQQLLEIWERDCEPMLHDLDLTA